MGVRGVIDSCDAAEIRGWAWDPELPNEAVELQLLIDDQPCAVVRANLFGSDLALAGIGNGAHRFVASLVEWLPADGRHRVAVTHAGVHLENSPALVAIDALDVVAGYSLRDLMATRFLTGDGIEIGALNQPQRIPNQARVRYVDRFTNAELAAYFPQLDASEFVPVAVIDDGETLATFTDNSVDFVIANNFLEHCQDTLGTMRCLIRVLRDNAILFVTVPSRRANIDHARAATSIAEFIADHEVGPHTSRHQSYVDWVANVVRAPGPEVEMQATALQAQDYSIHFHVFTEFEVMAMLALLRDRYHLDFTVEAVVNDRSLEITFVLRKGPERPLRDHGQGESSLHVAG